VLTFSGGDPSLWLLIPAVTLVPTGMGLFVPSMIGLVLRTVPTEDAGSASGIVATAQQLGNAMGAAIVGSIFFSALGSGARISGYASAFAIGGAYLLGIALIGAGLSLRTRSNLRRKTAAGPETAAKVPAGRLAPAARHPLPAK
jgi:predicted MFS family arabinose efflux permease